jgi:23S rRNA pseudouridine2604 synthase
MTTLKLKKDTVTKPAAPGRAAGRGPLRGIAAPRKQVTLAQAQAERAARLGSPDDKLRDDAAAGKERRTPSPSPSHPPRRERPPVRRDELPQRSATARPEPPLPRARPPRRDPSAHRSAPSLQGSASAAEGERLSKRMTAMGLSSRREADDWIAAGWVRVDGKLAVLGQRIGPAARIDIDARARTEQAQQVTILLNKPIGYVSGQAEDGYEPAAVLVRPENRWPEDRGIKFHPGHLRHLAPAGRLDIDSVGLLVLTQDGRVAKALVGENSRIEKEYLVRVKRTRPGPLSERELALLEHGLSLDDQPLKPAKVSWANEDQLRFVLREGKKRQIRRMCELVGLEVLGLKRVRIGSVVLGKLPVGQWRYLRSDEFFG